MAFPDDQLCAFGERLRSLREARSLSQEAFAEMAGIHRTYVSGVEQGRRNVGLRNVFRFARALGVDAAALFADLD